MGTPLPQNRAAFALDLVARELRADARFSDGSPVLASDVAATYASMADPASQSPYRALFSTISTGTRMMS
jgi:hypothetical protein